MEFWQSVPWKALVSSTDPTDSDPTDSDPSDSVVNLSLPFALIGSHPICNVQIKRRRVPSLAYIVFSFPGSIEVWPLCALAYPQWGVLDDDQRLRVGRTSIQLVQEKVPESAKLKFEESLQSTEKMRVSGHNDSRMPLMFEMDFRGKGGSFFLDRRVVILGSDHPSTRRLHGVGMAACDHAVVYTDQRGWLINLQPTRGQVLTSLVDTLAIGGEKIRIGKIDISTRLLNADEYKAYQGSSSKDLPISSSVRQNNQNRDQRTVGETGLVIGAGEEIKSLPEPESASDSVANPPNSGAPPAQVDSRNVVDQLSTVNSGSKSDSVQKKRPGRTTRSNRNQKPERNTNDAEKTKTRRQLDAWFSETPNLKPTTKKAVVASISESNNIEEVTDVVTDQLIAFGHSHWWQRPVMKALLIAMIFISAFAIVGFLAVQFVLPKVLDLEGW